MCPSKSHNQVRTQEARAGAKRGSMVTKEGVSWKDGVTSAAGMFLDSGCELFVFCVYFSSKTEKDK